MTKVFAAEQKLQELKNRIPKIKAILDKNKYKIPLTAIIKCSTENINNVESEKYKLTPNKIEKGSLESENFKTEFNFEPIKISKGFRQTGQV